VALFCAKKVKKLKRRQIKS